MFIISALNKEQQKNEVENLRKRVTCVICDTNRREIVFIPCGHLALCCSCDKENKSAICVICKKLVTDRKRVRMTRLPE